MGLMQVSDIVFQLKSNGSSLSKSIMLKYCIYFMEETDFGLNIKLISNKITFKNN